MKRSIVSPYTIFGSTPHRYLYLLLLIPMISRPALAQAQNPETLLQAAINAELVEGDLEKAIRLYQQICDQFSGHRTIAAQALLRLGQSYEKLGNQQAAEVYERLIAEYADQGSIVAEARARLQILTTDTAGTSNAASVARQLLDLDIGMGFGRVYRDGVQFVYANSDGDVEVRNLVTGDIRTLTTEGNSQTEYTKEAIYCLPSPTGRSVVYSWTISDNSELTYRNELRTINISTGEIRTVYQCERREEIIPTDWTPDGLSIIAFRYTRGRRMTDFEMILISATDGRSQVITELGEEDPHWIARVSPDGRFVAHETRPTGVRHREVIVTSINGALKSNVSQSTADDGLLGWSPDGSMLLFSSDRQGTNSIWGMKIVGGEPIGNPILLSSGSGKIRPLGISQEGTLYYSSSMSVSRHLLGAMNKEKSELADEPRILSEGNQAGFSIFSPDGLTVAYNPGPPALYPMINILSIGTDRTHSIRPDLSITSEIIWSPDMSSLLTLGKREETGEGLYWIDPATGSVELELAGEEWTARPSHITLLPDSRDIIYSMSDPENVNRTLRDRVYMIMRRSLDTGAEEELYRGGSRTWALTVSPDNQWLVYAIQLRSGSITEWGNEIWRCSLTSGEASKVSFVPYQSFIYDLVWSEDGRELYTILKKNERVFTATDTTLVYRAEFCRIPFKGGEPIITPLELDDNLFMAYLSPGGKYVAYFTHRDAFRDELWSLSNFLPARDRER
ncbi:tetratricopeptide repeat protein [Gemmatimonadota bacterium]